MILNHTHARHSQSPHRDCPRAGFTLVELMVAAALSITIMWILAYSFKEGIDFARSARSTGNLMTQLNNVGQVLLRDLQSPHFLPTTSNNNGQLSLCHLEQISTATSLTGATGYTPPNGYFEFSSPPPSAQFIDDTGNFPSDIQTGAYLRFTVYLPQGLPQNQFVATSPAGGTIYSSQAAEVAYFLAPQANPAQTPPVILTNTQNTSVSQPSPQTLYNLYRRQRLVAINQDYTQALMPAITADPNAADVISFTQLTAPQTPKINQLTSFSQPYAGPTANSPGTNASRIPLTPMTTPGRVGDDIVLSNVLSFEILSIYTPSTQVQNPPKPYTLNPAPVPPNSVPGPQPFTIGTNKGNANYTVSSVPYNSNYPFDHLPQLNFNPNRSYIFDTGNGYTDSKTINNWNNFSTAPNNPNLIPMPARVTALQITIRIYDPQTKQTRQNTYRVAM